MEIQEKNIQPMKSILDVQVFGDKCEKILNNMLRTDKNNVFVEEYKNESLNSSLQEGNSHQTRTYSRINRILKPKFKTNIKHSTPQLDKTKTTTILINDSIESGSSTQEVFQTRYSVNTKNNFHTNDCSPIITERFSDKGGSVLDLNTKTSPIIIQATPYNEKKDFYDSNKNKISNENKQEEINFMNESNAGIESRSSLSNTENSDDIGSNSLTISNENSNEQYNIKESSDNIAVDFLTGSFDISAYLPKKQPSDHGKYAFSMSSDLEQSENIKERKKYNKRNINELTTTNKRKSNNPRLSKKEPFQDSTPVFTSLNDMKSDIRKNVHKSPTKTKNKKSVHEISNDEDFNLTVFANKKDEKMQKNKTKDTLLNREHDFSFKRSHDKTPLRKKNASLKEYKYDNITAAFPNSTSSTRYPKRRLRNSSLIASKKIKEIELLENLSDSCEEIDFNEEKNYKLTPKKYIKSKDFFTAKANKSAMKEKHENDRINRIKKKEQAENKSNEYDGVNDTLNYSTGYELKEIKPASYKTDLVDKPLKAFDQSKESVLGKRELKRNKTRNFISNTNLVDEYLTTEVNNDFGRSLQNNFRNKKDTNNIISLNESINENKHRTWNDLEKELLEELDEIPFDNICKTVILHEEEVIKKEEVTNDTNLFTVSNRSLRQTIRKSKIGNKYNMHCEIKNRESKILESKPDNSYFQNRFRTPCSTEIVPSNNKSINILDKTIAAMENCAKNFSSPKGEIFDYEEKEVDLELEASHDSDTDHETQFHASEIFMAKDNRQYFSNEIVGYTKKLNKDNKREINFKKSNVTKIVRDFKGQLKDDKKSNYRNAENSEEFVSVSRNYLFGNYPQEVLCQEKSLALVPSFKESPNPWSKLMKELDVKDYEEDKTEDPVQDPIFISKINENEKKQISKLLVTEANLMHSSNKQKHEISIDKTDKMKFQEEQKQLTAMQESKIKPLVDKIAESKNIDSEEQSPLCETKFENKVNEKVNKVNENLENDKYVKSIAEEPLKEIKTKTVINKEDVVKIFRKNSFKRSPTYKLKIDKDQSLKLKHSNNSSSLSNSSQEFMESKEIATDNSKNIKHNYRTSNKREEYAMYLKHKLSKKASLIEKGETDSKTKPEEVQPQKAAEEIHNQSAKYQQKKGMKLIAQNEDDLFSLSSSDSETSKM